MNRRNSVWVRINGQAEMRGNVRAALKRSRLTQKAAAELAGMTHSRLTGFLAGQTWWNRDDLEAIVGVLVFDGASTSLTELQGGSIFRDDPEHCLEPFHHSPEYDHRGRRAPAPAPAVETRALCCTCGTLRQISVIRGEQPAAGEHEQRRWVLAKYCTTCDTQTQHAVLRFGEHRDFAEIRDHAPTGEQVAQVELKTLLARLAELNVEVSFRRQPTRKKDKGKDPFLGGYEFDESKSHWLIEIDPAAPARMQVELLTDIWDRIARDEHRVDWDARDGVIIRATQLEYDAAVDELMNDLRRYLDLERRRLVQGVVDDIARDGTHQVKTADSSSEADR